LTRGPRRGGRGLNRLGGGSSLDGASGSFLLLRMSQASRTIIQIIAIGKRITDEEYPAQRCPK
jgi:hypothetical protein